MELWSQCIKYLESVKFGDLLNPTFKNLARFSIYTCSSRRLLKYTKVIKLSRRKVLRSLG